jgi:hypothetical protein
MEERESGGQESKAVSDAVFNRGQKIFPLATQLYFASLPAAFEANQSIL